LFDDATGANPAFPTAGLPLWSVVPVALRVTDAAMNSVISQTTITIMPAILYVDSRASGGGDGASWAGAFTNLPQAMSLAVPRMSIRVAGGTYKPTTTTDRTKSFSLKTGVAVYGGYAGLGAPNPDARNITAFATVFSGDIGVAGDDRDNSYHVFSNTLVDSSALLDGVTVTGGNANVLWDEQYGGGMYNVGASPTLSHCTFTANVAIDGGALAGLYDSSMLISDCTFVSNFGSDNGGAIDFGIGADGSPQITRCAFTGNTAGAGGAVWNEVSATYADCSFDANYAGIGGAVSTRHAAAQFVRCVFTSNRASGGGAVICDNDPAATGISTFVNSRFIRNIATATGGAVFNNKTTSSFVGCLFTGNVAPKGGAIYNDDSQPALNNCVIAGNRADYGGALYSKNSSSNESAAIANSTITGNTASISGGALYNSGASPALANCIMWNDSAPSGQEVFQDAPPLSVTFSDIQGGFTGAGNINADPQFVRNPTPGADGVWGTVDDDYGDLRLRITSPCIDVGSNAAVPAGVTTDIAGNSRIADVPGKNDPGAIVDMGAYERPAPFADADFLVDASRPSIRITFNTDASAGSISAGDLLLVNLTTSAVVDCGTASSVSYNAATRTATWAFSINLPDGNYRATLPAGNVLDTTNSPILTTDLTIDFFVLAGDANRDRMVDIQDLGILSMNWQGSGKLFSQGDFNYDGKVDAADLGILSTNWQKSLSAPVAPAQPAALVQKTPKRTATRMVNLVL
jgi:hypothetical protein